MQDSVESGMNANPRHSSAEGQPEDPPESSEHDPGGTASQPDTTSSRNGPSADEVQAFMNERNESYHGLSIRPEMCVGFNPSTRNETKENANAASDDQTQEISTDQSSIASFGADGTTATVNSYGNLMQISKFLGVGRSGIFSADSYFTDEPYEITSRILDLNHMASRCYEGMGFIIMDDDEPQLDFICDRWPRFTRARDGYKHTTQYFASNGIVFQQFIFEQDGPNGSSQWLSDLDRCTVDADIKLRDLEWQDPSYQFNKDDFYDETSYKTTLENHGYSLVRSHKGLALNHVGENAVGQNNNDGTVELVMAVFLSGRARKFVLNYESAFTVKEMESSDREKYEGSETKRVEVTVAYRLQLQSTNKDWHSWCIQAQELVGLQKSLPIADFNKSFFSADRTFDYIMRRNLENILSNCCIPVEYDDSKGKTPTSVAITCGDLSGHRIVTSASFFAFRFLISIYEYLSDQLMAESRTDKRQHTQKKAPKPMDRAQCVDNEVLRALARRIEVVCRGHFNWILKLAEAGREEKGAFCSDYWVSGHRIRHYPGQRPGFLGSNSFVDAAFQFVKVEVFLKSRVSPFGRNSTAEATEGKVPKEESDSKETEQEEQTKPEKEGTTRKGKERQPNEQPIESYRSQGKLDGNKRPQKLIQKNETEVIEQIESRARRWITHLQNSQKRSERGPFAFPRFRDEVAGNDNYFLDDHVWIWRALKALENMGHEKVLNIQQSSSGTNSEDGRKYSMVKNYSSAEAQKHILKRFTTENPASTKRMLAVFRSSSETRFMFRSRDTALFYGMRHSLFSMSESNEVVDVWKNTLETQVFHQHNDPSGWSNPMRYALALIMGSEGCPINSKPVGKTFQTSYRTLIGSSGVHGLFPGRLHELTKQPEPLLEAENLAEYWHATFEIPYVIWICPYPRTDAGSSLGLRMQKGSITKPQAIPASKEVIVTTKTLPFNNFIDQQSIVELQDEWLYNEPSFLDFDPELRSVKCKNTIETAIISIQKLGQTDCREAIKDLGGCVSKLGSSLTSVLFSDCLEEYCSNRDKPDIEFPQDFHVNFQKNQDLLINQFDELKRLELLTFMLRLARNKASEDWRLIFDGVLENLKSRTYEHHGTFDIVPSTIRDWKSLYLQFKEREDFPTGTGESGVFFDVLRSSKEPVIKRVRGLKEMPKRGRPRLDIKTTKDNKEFMERISSTRRASSGDKTVKKRLICLPRADEDTAMLCCLALPWSMRDDLFRFFKRHRCYDKYFFDETTAVLNTWRTEFHMSFYQIHGEKSPANFEHLPKLDTVEFSKDKFISRAAVGFHFNGDFFDRYWTCHFIEFNIACGHIRNKSSEISTTSFEKRMLEILEPNEYLPSSELDKYPWRQRKVLELILFDKMLKEFTDSTEEIVENIRSKIKQISGTKQKDGPSNSLRDTVALFQIKASAYPDFSSQSKKFEEILNVLEDNLSENLEQVARWENREKARAPERPRWTRNDERKYRPTITKLLASTERRVQQLKHCRTNVQGLMGYLASTREYIRDDLNLRGAEDVRLFTYVTATFLPLGFAASIFSMGGFPAAPVLGSMIGLAFFALFLTAVAIIRKKKIASLIDSLRHSYSATRSNTPQDRLATLSTATGRDAKFSSWTTGISLTGVKQASKNATDKFRGWFTASNDNRLPT